MARYLSKIGLTSPARDYAIPGKGCNIPLARRDAAF